MTEFSIYQINVDRDTANVCFIGMESLEKIKGTKEVNAAAYDRVYDGKMDCISLENIYQKFNVDHIVFSQESFNKPYDEKSRTYAVSSDNKAFKAGLGGYSIYGSCLDGSDPCVRLDGYMRGENAWKIEKCYLKEASREMLDIICGKFFICHAPYEAERFQSLPPDLAEKYREKFQYPERFARINDKIVAVPFKPAKADRDR